MLIHQIFDITIVSLKGLMTVKKLNLQLLFALLIVLCPLFLLIFYLKRKYIKNSEIVLSKIRDEFSKQYIVKDSWIHVYPRQNYQFNQPLPYAGGVKCIDPSGKTINYTFTADAKTGKIIDSHIINLEMGF